MVNKFCLSVILLTFAHLTTLHAQTIIDHGYHSHHNMSKGACPVLNNTLGTRRERFYPQKMKGTWKTVYESKERTKGMDCLSVKFQDFEGGNKTQLHALIGHILVDQDLDLSRFEDIELEGAFFDDAFLTFGHPENAALASVHESHEEAQMTKGELVRKQMKPLTRQQKKELSEEEIKLYEDHAHMLLKFTDQELDEMDHSDPYDLAWQILETDYDQYFISYMCHELHEEVNQDGLTEEEIWDMENIADMYYDNHFTNQTYHYIIAGIHVRNISDMHPVQLRQYLLRLDMMVPDHDFRESGHDLLAHGYKCPTGDEDLFESKWIHSYKDMMRGIDEDDGSVHYRLNYDLVRPNKTMNVPDHTDL